MKRYLLLLGFVLGSFLGWMPLKAQNPVLFIGEAVAGGTTGNLLYVNGSVLGQKAATTLAFPGTLSIASGKTGTFSNTLTLAGTDSTTMTFPTTSATVARTDAAQTFAGVQSFYAGNIVLGDPTHGGVGTGYDVNITNSVGGLSVVVSNSLISFNGLLGVGGRNYLLGSNSAIAWTNGIDNPFATQDLFLLRDSANILAQRNGTAAQTSRIYETYTDGSNYSRLAISAPSGGPITFASEAAGTGTARSFQFTGGAVKGGSGFQSSDGTTGLTATCTLLSITTFVVKNGLVTACS